jgi:hypothetical protein
MWLGKADKTLLYFYEIPKILMNLMYFDIFRIKGIISLYISEVSKLLDLKVK